MLHLYKNAGGRNTESGKQLQPDSNNFQDSRLHVVSRVWKSFSSFPESGKTQFSRLSKENLQTLSCWWQITFVFQSLEKLSFPDSAKKTSRRCLAGGRLHLGKL